MAASRTTGIADSAKQWSAERVEGAQDWIAEQVGGPARQKVILLLACVLGVQAADLATTGEVATKLEPAFHIGNFQIGLLVSVTLFTAAVATLPRGILADRIDRTNLLAASVLLWCAAIVAGGFSVDYLMLVLSRLALGAVTAAGLPAVASLTGDYFPVRDRARVYGSILSGELIGAGVGYFISGNIAGIVSWRWSFWWLVIPGMWSTSLLTAIPLFIVTAGAESYDGITLARQPRRDQGG